MIFFKAKTREGHCMKVMAELLQNNIKTAYFQIDEVGISLCMMDTHRTILINMDLDANNFTVYKYKRDEKMFIGINLTHFHKMLKSIKKRDSIELFIDDETPTDLGIKVIPKENNRTTTSYIKIQEIQNLKIQIPEGYGKPIIVPSGEFQKMCKGMAHIGTSILITAKAFQIQFACDAGGVMKRVTDFGESDDSDSDSDDEKDEKDKYTDEFNTEQLMRITKMAGLSQNIQIFPKEGLPLLFKSSIGMLGSISIYIKSKTLLSKESQIIEDSDEDD